MKGFLGDIFPMFRSMSTTGEGSMDNLMNKMLGTGLTSAEREANAFSSSEAEKSRQFTAAEADRDRAWQEEQMLKYNSLSGKIAQARESGVNPMYAVTGNAVSPSSATGHSSASSSASSVPPSSGNIGGLISSMLSAFKTQAEVKLLNSEARKNNADAQGQEIYNTYADALNSGNVEKIKAETANILSSTEVNEERVKEMQASIANLNADTAVKYDSLETARAQRDKIRTEIQGILQGLEESAKRIDLYDAQIGKLIKDTESLTWDIKVISDPSVHESRKASFMLGNQSMQWANKIQEINATLAEYEKAYSEKMGHGAYAANEEGNWNDGFGVWLQTFGAITGAIGNIFSGSVSHVSFAQPTIPERNKIGFK